MNVFLWVLQILTALLYAWSGFMKIFKFEEMSAEVKSFGALPQGAWTAMGVVELICVLGLILPSALRWHPRLTVIAAVILALESLVFIGVHVKYHELPPIIMSAVLGLIMAFIAYVRMFLKPIL